MPHSSLGSAVAPVVPAVDSDVGSGLVAKSAVEFAAVVAVAVAVASVVPAAAVAVAAVPAADVVTVVAVTAAAPVTVALAAAAVVAAVDAFPVAAHYSSAFVGGCFLQNLLSEQQLYSLASWT